MKNITVIGAGIIGLCTAIHLQRKGCRVTLIDAQGPGENTSYGNAALLSVDSIVPISTPGMLRKVPGWLMDAQGPLSVRWSYLLKAAPWLWKWIRAGRDQAVERSCNALHALHGKGLSEYEALLGMQDFRDLIRVTGQVHAWEEDQPGVSETLGNRLRAEHGVQTRYLDRDELLELAPGISPAVKRALLFLNNGHAVSPLRLTRRIAEQFAEAGGMVLNRKVLRIVRTEGRFLLMTNSQEHRAEQVVVAAGAWSARLLDALGVRIPLETERGYHADFDGFPIDLKMPILNQSRAVGLTPLEHGLRCAGTVEIAGLDAPPRPARAQSLIGAIRAMFPGAELPPHRIWMGYRPSMPDSLPILDACPDIPGLYVACGHGHTGMTAGAVSGRLMSQIILGEPPLVDPQPYRMARFA